MRTIPRFASVTLLVAVMLTAGKVRAATPTRESQRESESERQYRTLLDQAVIAYEAHRFEEARALFRRANEISPNARTLRGIGMTCFELRDYVEALESLEGSLADKRRPLTPAQRLQVQALAARTRVFIGRFHFRLSPKDSVLRIDGAAVALDNDDSLMLGFGRHLITVEAPGGRIETRDIDVVGGERVELVFELAPGVAATPRPPVTDAPKPAPLQPAPGDGQDTPAGSRHAGWWVAGAGLFAAGTVASVIWWRFQDRELSSCNDALAQGNVCGNRSILSFRERLALGAVIGSAVGAVALGTIGAVTWAKSGKDNGNKDSAMALSCSPGAGGAPMRLSCELALVF